MVLFDRTRHQLSPTRVGQTPTFKADPSLIVLDTSALKIGPASSQQKQEITLKFPPPMADPGVQQFPGYSQAPVPLYEFDLSQPLQVSPLTSKGVAHNSSAPCVMRESSAEPLLTDTDLG